MVEAIEPTGAIEVSASRPVEGSAADTVKGVCEASA